MMHDHPDHLALIAGVSTGLGSVIADDVATWLGKLIGGILVGTLTGLLVRWLDRKVKK